MAHKNERMDNVITGVFSANERGFGFVRREPPLEDLYIPADYTNGALDQDVVLASVEPDGSRAGGYEDNGASGYGYGENKARDRRQRQSGVILKIVEYANTTLVGAVDAAGDFYFAVPDNRKLSTFITIKHGDLNGARKGQKVLLEIVERGTANNGFKHRGRVIEIIGYAGAPGVDMLSILCSHGFSIDFPDGALAECEAIPEKVDTRKFRGRRDLRGVRLFTIDGADSKDLDDAVSIEVLNGGGDADVRPGADVRSDADVRLAKYKLGVHIADVAAYVMRGSALDAEALRRGTSLYYADRVVPMLPQKLSNGICSLHPHVDRLALSVFIYIDGAGKILDYEIDESVINSSYRMTYDNVWLMLEKRDAALLDEYAEIGGDLIHMKHLADLLRERRISRGALDFETKECVIKLDADGAPISVGAYVTTYANQLIEEFMIACNETVATHIMRTGLPFIYRTHGEPDREKIDAVVALANSIGVGARDVQGVLRLSKDTKYKNLLSLMLLRAMDKAAYTAENTGHYGLASECYCHFTSPIRRYPDLLAHRIVKAQLKRGGITRDENKFYGDALRDICDSCSERERAAEESERDIEALKKVEYMKPYVGETFDGVISGTTSFGMFVELENTVEGLVRVADMADDYYTFDPERYTLTGRHTGNTYRIGDAARVTLVRANVENRQIDFVLSGMRPDGRKPDGAIKNTGGVPGAKSVKSGQNAKSAKSGCHGKAGKRVKRDKRGRKKR